MKRKLQIIVGVGAVVMAATWMVSGDGEVAPPQAAVEVDGETASSDPGAAVEGYRVAIDPVSGEFVEAADEELMPADPWPEQMGRSLEGLIEVDSPTGAKGVKVSDLFQHTFTVTIGDDGDVHTVCNTEEGE
jgi:hypothetical protein